MTILLYQIKYLSINTYSHLDKAHIEMSYLIFTTPGIAKRLPRDAGIHKIYPHYHLSLAYVPT